MNLSLFGKNFKFKKILIIINEKLEKIEMKIIIKK